MFLALLLAADSPPLSHARVAESLETYAQLQCSAEQVHVEVLGLAWVVDPPADAELHWSGDPCTPNPSLQLNVYQQGARVGRYTLRPDMDVLGWGWVATAPADRGERIVTQRVLLPVWECDPYLPESAPVARLRVDSGDVLTQRNAAFEADLLEGAQVTLRVQRGPVVLETPGELLEDGRVGQPVRALNTESGKAVEGVLAPSGLVVIP